MFQIDDDEHGQLYLIQTLIQTQNLNHRTGFSILPFCFKKWCNKFLISQSPYWTELNIAVLVE